MCGSDITYQPPATVDYGESMREGLQAQVDLAPELFRAEADPATGRKAYARLNQEILNESLLGRKVTYDEEGRIIKGFRSDSSKYEIVSQPKMDSERVETSMRKGNGRNSSYDEQYLSVESIVPNYVIYDTETGKAVGVFDNTKDALAKVRTLGGTGYSPIYEEDENGNVVKDPSRAGQTTYTGGGMVSNIGGDQEREFVDPDGTKSTRKAGFDKNGNFAGVSALARDLQQLDTAQRFAGELKAIEDNADQFTEAYRSQGNIKGALAKVQQLSNVSSVPADISARGNTLTDIASGFNVPQIGIGQQAVGGLVASMGGQQQDPNAFTGSPQVAQGSGMASGMGGQQQVDGTTGRQMFEQDNRPMSPTTAVDGVAPPAIDDPRQGVTSKGSQRLPEDQRRQALSVHTRRRGSTYITEIRDLAGNVVEQYSANNMEDAEAWGEKNLERIKSEREYNTQQEQKNQADTQSQEEGQQQASELLQAVTGNQETGAGGQQQQVSGQGALPTVSAEGVGDMGGLRSQMLTQAKEDLALGGDLSDRDLRNAQQQARMASTARGRERDTSSILAELQNNEMVSRARQAERRGFASQVYGMEGQVGVADAQLQLQAEMANQQTSLAAQSANQQARMQQQAQLLDAAKADIDRNIAVDQMNTQYEMAGLAQDRGAAAQMVGLEQATAIDPTQAMFGRPSGAGTFAGQNLYGNAASNNQMPMLYNPSQGAEFIANQAAGLNSYNAAYMGAQAQVSAGKSAMFGNILSGIAQGAGAAYACWVAREVYGSHNPRWVMFRNWMLSESPSWFRILYMNFGERFARFIKDKPRLKTRIRKWMDSKINRSV